MRLVIDWCGRITVFEDGKQLWCGWVVGWDYDFGYQVQVDNGDLVRVSSSGQVLDVNGLLYEKPTKVCHL